MQGTLLLDGIYLAIGDRADRRSGGCDPTPAVRPRRRRDAPVLLPDRPEARPVAHAAASSSWSKALEPASWTTCWPPASSREPPSAPEGATLTVAGLWVFALGTALVLRGERPPAPQAEARPRPPLRDGGSDGRRPGVRRTSPTCSSRSSCSTFGFARGVVLASAHGDLELLAWTESEKPTDLAVGVDRSGVAGLEGTHDPAPARDRPRHGSSARIAHPRRSERPRRAVAP